MTEDFSDHAKSSDASEKPRESVGEIIRTVIYALLIALVFRTFVFQPFWIPSGSMKSTLLVGDYLFISKYSYGYSRFSLPYGNLVPEDLFPGRIFASDPERGDVIVFKYPHDDETDYIKRLIGLPGDRVRVSNGVLEINGTPVGLRRIEDFVEIRRPRGADRQLACKRDVSTGQNCVKERFVETLPNGVEHIILNADGNRGRMDNTREFLVPAGHFFFMGDNRDNSQDSRASLGFVPVENVLGRAELIFLSSEGAFWEFWEWRGDRFLKWIE